MIVPIITIPLFLYFLIDDKASKVIKILISNKIISFLYDHETQL